MKAKAWKSSRTTPTITNFLVLMFSMIAPAISALCLRPDKKEKKKRVGNESRGGEKVTASRWTKVRTETEEPLNQSGLPDLTRIPVSKSAFLLLLFPKSNAAHAQKSAWNSPYDVMHNLFAYSYPCRKITHVGHPARCIQHPETARELE